MIELLKDAKACKKNKKRVEKGEPCGRLQPGKSGDAMKQDEVLEKLMQERQNEAQRLGD
jgi:hypothetical protein